MGRSVDMISLARDIRLRRHRNCKGLCSESAVPTSPKEREENQLKMSKHYIIVDNHTKQQPISTMTPEEIIEWDDDEPPVFVVTEILKAQPKSTQLWAMLWQKDAAFSHPLPSRAMRSSTVTNFVTVLQGLKTRAKMP
jgi:hypothetical protein